MRRKRGWDYRFPGFYFITINAHNRRRIFGEIIDSEVRLNKYGRIVDEEWKKSKQIREDYKFGEYVIMPDHFHALIEIKTDISKEEIIASKDLRNDQYSNLVRQRKSLSSFIGCFKSAVISRINDHIRLKYSDADERVYTRKNRLWQANFHDKVVIDNNIHFIEDYIRNNPRRYKGGR